MTVVVNQLRSELFQMNSELTQAVNNFKTVTETNALLKNKVDALEVKTNDLEKRVDKCENDRTKETDTLNILTNELDGTRFKVLNLENKFADVKNLSSVDNCMNASIATAEKALAAISKRLNDSVEEEKTNISMLHNRISDLETNTSTMIQAETATLSNLMSYLETNTSAKIQAETAILNNRMSSLESSTSSRIQAVTTAIEDRISIVQSNISGIIQRGMQRDDVSRLNITVSNLVRNAGLMGSVRFHVTFNDSVRNGSDKQVLKFDKIVLNDGEGYNISTGIFTCPVSGLYIVTIRGACNFDTQSVDKKDVYLYKNDEFITYTLAEKPAGRTAGRLHTSSATVPVVLEKGDQLYTRLYFSGTGSSLPAGADFYFSGTLVAPKF